MCDTVKTICFLVIALIRDDSFFFTVAVILKKMYVFHLNHYFFFFPCRRYCIKIADVESELFFLRFVLSILFDPSYSSPTRYQQWILSCQRASSIQMAYDRRMTSKISMLLSIRRSVDTVLLSLSERTSIKIHVINNVNMSILSFMPFRRCDIRRAMYFKVKVQVKF